MWLVRRRHKTQPEQEKRVFCVMKQVLSIAFWTHLHNVHSLNLMSEGWKWEKKICWFRNNRGF